MGPLMGKEVKAMEKTGGDLGEENDAEAEKGEEVRDCPAENLQSKRHGAFALRHDGIEEQVGHWRGRPSRYTSRGAVCQVVG